MTNLLLRLFVGADQSGAKARAKVGSLSGGVGIGCNVLLCLLKLLAGSLTGFAAFLNVIKTGSVTATGGNMVEKIQSIQRARVITPGQGSISTRRLMPSWIRVSPILPFSIR